MFQIILNIKHGSIVVVHLLSLLDLACSRTAGALPLCTIDVIQILMLAKCVNCIWACAVVAGESQFCSCGGHRGIFTTESLLPTYHTCHAFVATIALVLACCYTFVCMLLLEKSLHLWNSCTPIVIGKIMNNGNEQQWSTTNRELFSFSLSFLLVVLQSDIYLSHFTHYTVFLNSLATLWWLQQAVNCMLQPS